MMYNGALKATAACIIRHLTHHKNSGRCLVNLSISPYKYLQMEQRGGHSAPATRCSCSRFSALTV